MTDEQIEQRVEQFCKDYHTLAYRDPTGEFIPWAISADALESLCREMIAEGLERAADDAKQRMIHADSNAEGQNEEPFIMWLEVGQGHRLAEKWCREEAAKIREGRTG